jgi:biopolymer transport protein TolR
MSMNLGNSTQSTINVTPLIDVLLTLLVIFMIIQPQHNRGERAEVPQESTSHPQDDNSHTIVVQLDGDEDQVRSVKINEQAASMSGLTMQLRDIFKARAQKVMFIQGTEKLSFSVVAEVMDAAHEADSDIRVGLMPP